MISTSNEQLINMQQVPKYLETKIGKKLHLGTIYRWCLKGLSGVQLETMVIGGTRVTSKEALDRFFLATTEAKSSKRHSRSRIDRRSEMLERKARGLGI